MLGPRGRRFALHALGLGGTLALGALVLGPLPFLAPLALDASALALEALLLGAAPAPSCTLAPLAASARLGARALLAPFAGGLRSPLRRLPFRLDSRHAPKSKRRAGMLHRV
ncbi:MAG TPA: hypothetical protein VFD84_01620 [Candidatus Binatia bacterium]|jgi:hypothetical protein|nr:hypothetical protein [Candidatus Binatia bacterium]